MSRLETNGYYALGVPLYLALCVYEHLVARRRGERPYGLATTIGTLSTSLGEVVLGLFLGPWLLALYDWALERFALFHWSEGSLVPWVLAFFAGDFCYYWYHRAGHTVAIFWGVHSVHHQNEEFNLTIALRHPWFSDFYSAPFYALLPLLGVPAFHFFIAITLISFYALTIHSHVFDRPSFGIFVTPETHIVHHAWNRRYLGKNYGAMFNLWDRLFGTHEVVVPEEPVRLGTSTGYETHNGALAQWVAFRRLFAIARQAPTWGLALETLFRPPGWLPPGAVAPARATPPRQDGEIPLATRLYCVAQFAATATLALYVLWLRDEHPFWVQVSASAIVLVSTATIGGLLDGRPNAVRDEVLRLAALAWLGAAFALGAYPVAGFTLIAVAFAGAVALLPCPTIHDGCASVS